MKYLNKLLVFLRIKKPFKPLIDIDIYNLMNQPKPPTSYKDLPDGSIFLMPMMVRQKLY